MKKFEKFMKNNIVLFAVALLTSIFSGFVGSFATSSSVGTWYAGLNKPFFNPPNFLFGPVWTLLYIMMGVSLFLFWKKAKSKILVTGSVVYSVQLFLNTIWSFAFFGAQSPIFGFIVILLLDLAVAVTIFEFRKVSKTAAYMLIPYLTWISFATVLNYAIMILN